MPVTASLRAAFNAVPLTVVGNKPTYGSTGLTHDYAPVVGQPATVSLDFVRASELSGMLKVALKNALPSMPGGNGVRDLVQNFSLPDEIIRLEKTLAAQLSPDQVSAKSIELRLALATWLLKTIGAV